MSGTSFRKIRFFGPGRRLAASEAPKIGGGASLARRENLSRFPAIRRSRVVRVLGPPGRPRWQRPNVGVLGFGLDRFPGFLGVQGQPGATREAQGGSGKPREAQDQLRNQRHEFQENEVFRP